MNLQLTTAKFDLFVATLGFVVALCSIFAQPLCSFLHDYEKGCGISLDDALDYSLAHNDFNAETAKAKWGNPGYIADRDRLKRRWFLLGMNLLEADFGRRMTVAIVSGAVIGFERRSADRPAGIRTMSLASMGACLFTLCGTFAFMNGPNGWDASRISAAIPSGVGFLGAGIIWKGTAPGDEHHSVRGLTTAASVWISAATGTAAGGGMYYSSIYGSILAVIVLRYGPRLYGHPDSNRDDDDECTTDGDENEDICLGSAHQHYGSIDDLNTSLGRIEPVDEESSIGVEARSQGSGSQPLVTNRRGPLKQRSKSKVFLHPSS